jgi:hypothetical protein
MGERASFETNCFERSTYSPLEPTRTVLRTSTLHLQRIVACRPEVLLVCATAPSGHLRHLLFFGWVLESFSSPYPSHNTVDLS